jgi:hypothetical protein
VVQGRTGAGIALLTREYAGDVIVVVGQPLYRESDAGSIPDGLAVRIALAAAGHARSVQVVGKAGEDAAGDAVVLALARGGVGHVALLREAGRPTPRIDLVGAGALDASALPAASTAIEAAPSDIGGMAATVEGDLTLEAADVDLGLRYLTDFAVVVLADRADAEMARVVGNAVGWADARLIVVVPAGEAEPAGLPPDAIVFEAPDSDPDGVFAAMVGSFAVALDDGDDPAAAFRSSVESGGWTPATAEEEPVGD